MSELKNERVLPDRFFRRNSRCERVDIGFLMASGGLGDYIGYLPALEWIARTQPQVEGTVYTADFFIPIAENVLKPYPHWKVVSRKELTEQKIKEKPLAVPNRFITRIGMNAVDLGYLYYAYMNPSPTDGKYYCKLDLSSVGYPVDKVRSWDTGKYAVMTPYSTNAPRTMTAKAFNGIKDHLISKGVTPVLIGKREFAPGRPALEKNGGYDFTGCWDLTESTTLLEAAKLMSTAEMVIGIDNGLLHLAAMTDVPLIMGFTVASPQHAEPRRKDARIYRVYPNRADLPCTFCQSRMRFFVRHDFGTCLYRDNLCTEVIGQPEDWTRLIDLCLLENNG
jgi:hypothetical protein